VQLIRFKGDALCDACTVRAQATYELTTDDDVGVSILCDWHARQLTKLELPEPRCWLAINPNDDEDSWGSSTPHAKVRSGSSEFTWQEMKTSALGSQNPYPRSC